MVDRVGGGGDRDGLTVDEDVTLVGLLEPVQDLHQGGLAGSVLSEKRVDLAAVDVEVDMIVCEHPREPLHDAAHLEIDAGGRWSGSLRVHRHFPTNLVVAG